MTNVGYGDALSGGEIKILQGEIVSTLSKEARTCRSRKPGPGGVGVAS